MAETIALDKRDGYIYDPIVRGYDTTTPFWKSISGTPTITSGLLSFNAAESASWLLHLYAEMEFLLNIPAQPTSGDVRRFGLQNPASDNLGAAYFDTTGTAFTANVIDGNGTKKTTTITWDNTNWSAAAVVYRIRWEKDQVLFLIGTNTNAMKIVASFASNVVSIPLGPLALHVKNGNSDAMLFTYIAAKRAAALI